MRRAPFVVLIVVLLWAAPAASAQRPALRADLAACETGPGASERFAVFTGSMPALRGTQRMSMRFDLSERRDGSKRWRTVRAPKFGRWERSKPRRAGFIYTKRVERLKQESTYRAIVRFRWFDAAGTIQRQARIPTDFCVQPSQRPDLQVDAVEIVPGPDDASWRYRVTVFNAGPTPAAGFAVGVVGGQRDLVRDVPGLAALERTTVELIGPRCAAGAEISVQLDVRGVVRESDEADNRSVRRC